MKAAALAYGGLIGASAGAISAVSLGIGATGLSLAGVIAIAAAGWVALASFPVVALVYKGKLRRSLIEHVQSVAAKTKEQVRALEPGIEKSLRAIRRRNAPVDTQIRPDRHIVDGNPGVARLRWRGRGRERCLSSPFPRPTPTSPTADARPAMATDSDCGHGGGSDPFAAQEPLLASAVAALLQGRRWRWARGPGSRCGGCGRWRT
jgi:hypothetical protein